MTDTNEPLKAAEPGSHPKAEKYGMPIEEAPNIVRRHFEVLGEQQAIQAAAMAHNMRVGPAMAAALNRTPEAVTPSEPTIEAPRVFRRQFSFGYAAISRFSRAA